MGKKENHYFDNNILLYMIMSNIEFEILSFTITMNDEYIYNGYIDDDLMRLTREISSGRLVLVNAEIVLKSDLYGVASSVTKSTLFDYFFRNHDSKIYLFDHIGDFFYSIYRVKLPSGKKLSVSFAILLVQFRFRQPNTAKIYEWADLNSPNLVSAIMLGRPVYDCSILNRIYTDVFGLPGPCNMVIYLLYDISKVFNSMQLELLELDLDLKYPELNFKNIDFELFIRDLIFGGIGFVAIDDDSLKSLGLSLGSASINSLGNRFETIYNVPRGSAEDKDSKFKEYVFNMYINGQLIHSSLWLTPFIITKILQESRGMQNMLDKMHLDTYKLTKITVDLGIEYRGEKISIPVDLYVYAYYKEIEIAESYDLYGLNASNYDVGKTYFVHLPFGMISKINSYFVPWLDKILKRMK